MWTSIFTGIGEASEAFFTILPKTGMFIDLIFIAIGTFGIFYWIYYELHIGKGGDNYLSKK